MAFVAEKNVFAGPRRVYLLGYLRDEVDVVFPEESVAAIFAVADCADPAEIDESGAGTGVVVVDAGIKFSGVMNTGLQEDGLFC